MIERHQDYMIRIPSVPAGGITDFPLQLDTDAPFALRLVKSRNIGLSGWRFQTPRRQYQSSQLRTDLYSVLNSGVFPSRGVVIYPQIIYPIGSQIVVDIGNNTGSPILNAILLFRGSKLFQDGAIAAPTYPSKLAGLPFTYETVVPGVPVSGSPIFDNQLQVIHDADFVYRCGLCDPFTLVVDGQPTSFASVTTPQFSEVYVQLKDESRKFYSNIPIHVNDLFGQITPFSTGAGGNDERVDFHPGLITPEIYIPRDHSLYFDVYRNDDPTNPAVNMPVDLRFRFVGQKVFQQ